MLEREHPRLDAAARRNFAAAMLALMSTENFVFLHRTLGFGPKEAHASVRAAIEAMLAGAT